MKQKYIEANNIQDICGMLHLPKAEVQKITVKVGIALAINRKINKLGLTHLEVAKKTGLGKSVISAIINGNLNKISTDKLIEVAQELGLIIHLKIA